ncbi:hypothetical protein [Nostoc sp. ChiQUE01b]|uniref:hypothetical protein n=1 Tax=Nostoc sp. ChiQUE01b TaxID=3075376 RepID=UPI002AD2B21E|nr:hypothetical protein [Nostoc sp. ChiQUE01b]MDZ8263217.1 hypothetical protein [Nostoc sp. ChiQUE01b]
MKALFFGEGAGHFITGKGLNSFVANGLTTLALLGGSRLLKQKKNAFYKICKELEVVFKQGKYLADLENTKLKLNCNKAKG